MRTESDPFRQEIILNSIFLYKELVYIYIKIPLCVCVYFYQMVIEAFNFNLLLSEKSIILFYDSVSWK